MVVIREWRLQVPNNGPSIVMRAPYYDELLAKNGGFLPEDIQAHALWNYYMIAMSAYYKEKNQLVYEGDPDPDFHAERVFCSVAQVHGVSPDSMLPYWSAVETQATMMGGDSSALPPRYKFNKRTTQ